MVARPSTHNMRPGVENHGGGVVTEVTTHHMRSRADMMVESETEVTTHHIQYIDYNYRLLVIDE